jgi:hypothetical protein
LNDMLPVGAANLFHFKHDQAQYSIKPDQYGKKPLIFPKNDLTASCYLNEFFFYVFSKFSDWQNMKSMAVTSLACVSDLTRSTWAPHEASGVGNWRIALPEVPCVSKMLIAYLASFLGVSPFRDTQSPMVDARLDLLYREAMDKLDEVDDEACTRYVARKMLAWYTKYPPKNDGAAAAVEASTAPPPRTPDGGPDGGPADEPRPKRGMTLSDDEGQADM